MSCSALLYSNFFSEDILYESLPRVWNLIFAIGKTEKNMSAFDWVFIGYT